MENHGRANHLLNPPGSPKNILLHLSQINQLLILLGLTHNTLPHFGKIQTITHILHSGLTQLPTPQLESKLATPHDQ
jgi:hypothetical protein